MSLSSEDYRLMPINALLSAGSSALAFIAGAIDPVITGLALPIAFFVVGKAVDVVVRLYLSRKDKD